MVALLFNPVTLGNMSRDFFSPSADAGLLIGHLAKGVATDRRTVGALTCEQFVPTETTTKSAIALVGAADSGGNMSLLTSTLSGLVGVLGEVTLGETATGTLSLASAGLFRFHINSSSAVITNAAAILIDDADYGSGANPNGITNMYGLWIVGLGNGSSTNVGIRVDASATTTASIWINNSGNSPQGGIAFRADKSLHLYSSQAGVLRSDAFLAASQGLWIDGTSGDGYLRFKKNSSDPSAPSANTGVVFMKDNGSGKMQIVARFPSGANQVIATEP